MTLLPIESSPVKSIDSIKLRKIYVRSIPLWLWSRSSWMTVWWIWMWTQCLCLSDLRGCLQVAVVWKDTTTLICEVQHLPQRDHPCDGLYQCKHGQMCGLPLVVASGSGPALMGKNWQSHIQLNWRQMNQVHNASLHSLLSKYSGVFQKGLGTLKGFKASIYVDPETPPRFNHAHSVPYALRDKVLFQHTRLYFRRLHLTYQCVWPSFLAQTAPW